MGTFVRFLSVKPSTTNDSCVSECLTNLVDPIRTEDELEKNKKEKKRQKPTKTNKKKNKSLPPLPSAASSTPYSFIHSFIIINIIHLHPSGAGQINSYN